MASAVIEVRELKSPTDARTAKSASRRADLSKVVLDSAKYPWFPPLPNG